VSVLLTGVAFAVLSFFIGKGLDIIDENNGYSKHITEAVKRYFH
jgi:hypothetical protein